MSTVWMLTTVDNPYNPFEDFSTWWEWDTLHGYNSCGKVAAMTKSTAGMSKEDENQCIEDAIDRIVFNDFTSLYVKVNEQTAKEVVQHRLSNEFDKKYLE